MKRLWEYMTLSWGCDHSWSDKRGVFLKLWWLVVEADICWMPIIAYWGLDIRVEQMSVGRSDLFHKCFDILQTSKFPILLITVYPIDICTWLCSALFCWVIFLGSSYWIFVNHSPILFKVTSLAPGQSYCSRAVKWPECISHRSASDHR